ncbi:MAG: hypothetical protein WCP12_11040 [bacterium]
MNSTINPFSDPDSRELWEILICRDIEGFLNQNWSLVAGDFLDVGFMGIDGCFLSNPDGWKLTFPDLASYRHAWLAQSRQFNNTRFLDDPREALYRAMRLSRVEVEGDSALVHKKFNGSIRLETGGCLKLCWQSLFFCRRIDGLYKIAGFVGYLPNLVSDETQSVLNQEVTLDQ